MKYVTCYNVCNGCDDGCSTSMKIFSNIKAHKGNFLLPSTVNMVTTRSGLSYGGPQPQQRKRAIVDSRLKRDLKNDLKQDLKNASQTSQSMSNFRRALFSNKKGSAFRTWIVDTKLNPLLNRGSTQENIQTLKELVLDGGEVYGYRCTPRVGECGLCGKVRTLSVVFRFEKGSSKKMVVAGCHCAKHLDNALKTLHHFENIRKEAQKSVSQWFQEYNKGVQGLF